MYGEAANYLEIWHIDGTSNREVLQMNGKKNRWEK